jgi:transcriptional regulator with XRE-family HTH domain
MHRKQLGLSQSDLAILVAETRETVSRYEGSGRLPDLETVLALEMVLGQSIPTLFAGITERVRDCVVHRAETLLESMNDKPTHENALKLALLAKLAHPDDEYSLPIWDAEG